MLARLRRKPVEQDELKPIANLAEMSSYGYETNSVRANVFSNVLEPHYHLDESGVVLFVISSPEAHMGDLVGSVKPGQLFNFGIRGIHGFKGGGKAIVFHGYTPFEKADGYEIISAGYVPHPEGGRSCIVEYAVNGVKMEPLVYGPGSGCMTIGAVLRALDYEIRKANGEDVAPRINS